MPNTTPLEQIRLGLLRQLGMGRASATSLDVITPVPLDEHDAPIPGTTGVIEWESVHYDHEHIAIQKWRTTILHEEILPRTIRHV